MKKEKLIRFNQQNILDAAQKLFVQKGVRQTTMDDIAKAADYSKSTIYVYFKSKEEIYHYIIYEHMCRLKDMTLDCVEKNGTFEECYHEICSGLVNYYEQYPLYFVSIMGNISVDEQDLQESEILRQIYNVGEEINDIMAGLFEKGMKENYLCKGVDILPAVFTLWASLGSLITMAYEKEAYLLKRMHMDRTAFLRYGFQLLLDSVKNRER